MSTKIDQALKQTKGFIPISMVEFMKIMDMPVFQYVFDKFWMGLYEEWDAPFYVDKMMIQWLGYKGEDKHQKGNMLRAIQNGKIPHKLMKTKEVVDNETKIYNIPANIKDYVGAKISHLIMTSENYQILAILAGTPKAKAIATELVRLGRLVTAYIKYEKKLKDKMIVDKDELNKTLEQVNKTLEQDNKHLKTKEAVIPKYDTEQLSVTHLCSKDGVDYVNVIRGRDKYTKRRMKTVNKSFPTSRPLLAINQHPNPMTKWADMFDVMVKNGLVKKVKLSAPTEPKKKFLVFQCINPFTP